MAILKLKFPESFWQEEPRTLLVSEQRKRFWGVLLDLYAEVARVCEKNGLRYFAGGGTLLGALRHRGMIPWDDDIDLLMPRDDYERLCKIAPTAFRAPYFWQTNATDPGSARGHAQLRNSSTTGILKDEMVNGRALFDFNQGLFIDIFPLDCLPDDPDERKRFCLGIEALRRKIFRVRLGLGLYRRFHLLELRHPSHLLSWMTGLWWQGVQRLPLYEEVFRLRFRGSVERSVPHLPQWQRDEPCRGDGHLSAFGAVAETLCRGARRGSLLSRFRRAHEG